MNSKNVKKQSAKALANVSLKLGKMSADSACCYIFHQPKMPATLQTIPKIITKIIALKDVIPFLFNNVYTNATNKTGINEGII